MKKYRCRRHDRGSDCDCNRSVTRGDSPAHPQGWSAEDLLRPKQQGVPRVKWREKIVQCNQCGNLFSTLVPTQKYCSIACKRTFHRKDGCETTARQYAAISGNWVRYLARLCQRSFRRESLSVDACLRILARQEGRCALTGVELTCQLERGVICRTNASIDRKIAGGPYTEDNVQLVCVAINKLRVDLPLDDFINWCRKVADYAVHEKP